MTSHLELPVKPTIRVGSGAPSSTVGAAGDVYIDEDTGEVYYREELSWSLLPTPSSSIGGTITGGTPGSVLFVDSTSTLSQNNAKLFWDEADERLGLGNNSPNGILHVTTTLTTGNVIIDGTGQVAISSTLGLNVTGPLSVNAFAGSLVASPSLAVDGSVELQSTRFVVQKAVGKASNPYADIRFEDNVDSTINVRNVSGIDATTASQYLTAGYGAAVAGVSILAHDTDASSLTKLYCSDGSVGAHVAIAPSGAVTVGKGTAGDTRFTIDTVTGALSIGSQTNQAAIGGSTNKLKMHTVLDSYQSRYTSLRANDALSASYDLQLPAAQGTADQFLTNDGSGNLAWTTKRAPSYNADWVTADTATKAITHSLGTRDVHVTVYDVSDYATILVDSIVRTDTNTVTLTASEAPGVSGWRVLITAAN